MNKGFVNNCRDLDEGCLFCPVRGKFESCSKDEMLAHDPCKVDPFPVPCPAGSLRKSEEIGVRAQRR